MSTGSDIAITLRAVYLALHRRSEARFARHGVSADPFVLLATLARGHALTQREPGRRMPSDPQHRVGDARPVGAARTGRTGHPSDQCPRSDGRPDEAETLVGLLSKVAEALVAGDEPGDEPTSCLSQEDEP
jgi:hypothetical protein